MKHKITIEVDEDNYIELVNIKQVTEELTGLRFESLGTYLSDVMEQSFFSFNIPHYWMRDIFD